MAGKDLIALRKKLNMTRHQFARYLGFAYMTVARWEKEGVDKAMGHYIKSQAGVA